jgi:translocation and assembly module TamA
MGRGRPGGWLLALALALWAAAPWQAANAQDAREAEQNTAAAVSEPPKEQDAEKPVRFRIELQAPDDLKAVIRASVDLYRWQNNDALTPELLARLAHQAEDDMREALATEGYFSPTVHSRVSSAEGSDVVTLSAEPGPRAHVAAVTIDLTGAIDADPSRARRLEELTREWRLPRGATFRQEDWDRAKRDALERLSALDYPAPRIADSRADIDPPASSASLGLRVDSGPRLRFGNVDVQGLERYEPARVRNLAPFAYGDAWDREKLTRFQRRLTATGYFASSQLELASDAAQDGIAPVKVRVIEAPPRRLELGVGYNTDTRVSTSASWRNQDLWGNGLRWRNDLRVDSLQQSASSTFELPETGGGWARSLGAQYQHSDVQLLSTDDLTFFGRVRSLEERHQEEYGLQEILEHATPSQQPTARTHALLFEYLRTWRSYDDLLSPTRGGSIQAVVGVVPGFASTQGLLRTILRAQWLKPLSPKLELTLRAEGGAVLSSSRTGVPQALLFRIGGNNDLRGYAYEGVGIRNNDVIMGARRYVLGTAEMTRWMGDSWGIAGFIDSGDAFDSDQPFSLKNDIGFGVRLRTPIGPVRADLAWAEHTSSPRLNFSVGVLF